MQDKHFVILHGKENRDILINKLTLTNDFMSNLCSVLSTYIDDKKKFTKNIKQSCACASKWQLFKSKRRLFIRIELFTRK